MIYSVLRLVSSYLNPWPKGTRSSCNRVSKMSDTIFFDFGIFSLSTVETWCAEKSHENSNRFGVSWNAPGLLRHWHIASEEDLIVSEEMFKIPERFGGRRRRYKRADAMCPTVLSTLDIRSTIREDNFSRFSFSFSFFDSPSTFFLQPGTVQ